MYRRFFFLSLVSSIAALQGQVAQTTNSITVTANRTPNIQPDQVVFAVWVDTSLITTRDEVIAALQGSGIGLANFTGVSTSQQYILNGTVGQTQSTLEWVFAVTTPLTNLKTETVTLTSLQQAFASNKSGMTLGFSVQGLQVSPQAAQSQPCSQADLLADAKSQAQKIAGPAGMTVGPVLALWSAVSTTPPGTLPTSYGRSVYVNSTVPSCTLTVKFTMGTGF